MTVIRPFNEINFAGGGDYREFPYDFAAEGPTGSEAITGIRRDRIPRLVTSLRRQRVR